MFHLQRKWRAYVHRVPADSCSRARGQACVAAIESPMANERGYSTRSVMGNLRMPPSGNAGSLVRLNSWVGFC